MKNYYIALLFLLHSSISAYSQKSFNSYAIKDFVKESGKINTGFIDSKNNIWIGTCSAEVIHFDGNTWNYYDKDFLKLGRSYDCVNKFYEDSQSRIWMVADGGIILYDKGTWTFYREKAPQYYTHGVKEWNGKMFFSSFRGINVFENDKWRFINLPTSISTASLEIDKNNKLWACFSNGDPCFLFDGDNWKEMNSQNSGLCSGNRNVLHLSADSLLYFSGPSGYFCSYDGKSFTDLDSKIRFIRFSYLSSILSLQDSKDVFVAGKTNDNANSLLAQVSDGETIYHDYKSGLVQGSIVDLALDTDDKIMAFSEDSISYEGILKTTSYKMLKSDHKLIKNTVVTHDLLFDFPETQNLCVRILNIEGKLVLQKDNLRSNLSLEDLRSGLYFVQLFDKNSMLSTEKIIKIE